MLTHLNRASAMTSAPEVQQRWKGGTAMMMIITVIECLCDGCCIQNFIGISQSSHNPVKVL